MSLFVFAEHSSSTVKSVIPQLSPGLFVWALITLGVTEPDFIGMTYKAATCEQPLVLVDYFGEVAK